MYRSNRSFNIPPAPRHPPGIWHLFPGEEGIWLSESSSTGWGIWSPCVRGGEFDISKSRNLWRGERSWETRSLEYVEDFRGKDCAFMVNWLQGLCRIWRYLNCNIFNIGFRLWMYLPAIECNNKKLNRGQLLCHDAVISIAWISSDYFESFLLPQLLRGENDAKQSDEFQAIISIGGIFLKDRFVWCMTHEETEPSVTL